MTAAAALDLRTFDALRPAAVEDSTWRRNLAALREVSPDLADWLDSSPLPDQWRPCLALDAWHSWRCEPAHAPAAWLGESAAPLVRARALLSDVPMGERNLALLHVGAGAELVLLLERLPRHCAVYVFESSPQALRAVLCAHLLDEEIRDARVLFAPLERADALLSELLARQEGLLPPGHIVCAPTDSAAEIEAAQKLCERLATEVGRRRAAEVGAIHMALRSNCPNLPLTVAPRLCVLALTGGDGTVALAEALVHAGAAAGVPTVSSVVCDPRSAHVLPHCRVIVEHRPTFTIGIGHDPATLPLPTNGAAAEWRIAAPAIGALRLRATDGAKVTSNATDGQSTNATTILAASPRIRALSEQLGARDVVDFFWGCDECELAATPVCAGAPQQLATPATIWLIGDLPEASAAAAGVQQPTHKLLWSALLEIARERWTTPKIASAAGLLLAAERRTKMKIGEEELRARFVRVIEDRLVPAIVWEQILRGLPRERLRLVGVGAGWGAAGIDTLRAAEAQPPMGAIIAGYPDPLSHDLLRAAARGIPLAMHWPTEERAALVGGVLYPREHFAPFADAAQVGAFVEAALRREAGLRSRCERVREHLGKHTYRARLAAVLSETAREESRQAGTRSVSTGS